MKSGFSQASVPAGVTRRSFLSVTAAMLLPRVGYALSPSFRSAQSDLAATVKGSGAIATVLQQQTGEIVATQGDTKLADTPGSILKPMLLFFALQRNLISASTTVFCRRDLRIENKSYPCTHPQSNVAFTAQEAIASSCNTWFASLALRFTGARLVEALQAFGIHAVEPALPVQMQLLALGLAGVRTSPLQIANAYRILDGQLGQPFAKPVKDGLRDSVSFGMAHKVDVAGLSVSGKTGTASDPPRHLWSHGWFAGSVLIHDQPLVISMYLPQGNGADAAALARDFFMRRNRSI